MSTEDQDALLTKISLLAGQINRHKNGQALGQRAQNAITSNADSYAKNSYGKSAGYSPYPGYKPHGTYPTRGYGRGGRLAPMHRHRSLVLNGNTTTSSNDATMQIDKDENMNCSTPGAVPGSAWVTKNDRHRQLINSSIYEKESQKRLKTIEDTWKQKLKQRNDREKAKFNKHLRGSGYHSVTSNSNGPGRIYEINVQGISFHVANNGSKLVKVPGDLNAAKATPKFATIGGVKFYRSKNGNMYRSGIIKAHGKPKMLKKIDEPCKIFTTTGSCPNGPRCRYNHDPSKVAVCRDFLHKGSCPSGDSCDLSHELTPERTPTCMHFSKGNCSNTSCRYMHIRVSPSALVCRSFGIYGYCDRGANCTERHVHECPDFSNTGVCSIRGCKLLHRHKASVMRNNTNRSDQSGEDEASDISSDEDGEEIDSDDVDSDDLEFFGDDDGIIDSDMPMQKDFVRI